MLSPRLFWKSIIFFIHFFSILILIQKFDNILFCFAKREFSGRTQRRRDHPHHPTSAQGASPLPSETSQKRSRIPATRQSRVYHQMRHVGTTKSPLPTHAEQRRPVDRRLGARHQGQRWRQGFDEHHRAVEETMQPPVHVRANRRKILRPRRNSRRHHLRSRHLSGIRKVRASRQDPSQTQSDQSQGVIVLSDDATDDHHGGLLELEGVQVSTIGRYDKIRRSR